ncbi:ATP synthase subunit delta [Novosphingobium nitrogenifigens DSM 19370]|uniref:ATP synthase subunit delta n=1 Tax=Novosphingobium nitrogenifigens DSM 19370 TaxID=983920 RepID=F1Z8N1_9SPHN|nr:F0F1 ATP synthase subunit delta [Novosphingobium nitrogenifigens]EGD58994.1 ATP synthase subunit delta [Novosphingobium nitrogenifigens DSM 19370]
MGISGAITASLAGRYASALFDLASEQGATIVVESDLERLAAAISESADFALLIRDPQITREAAAKAVKAVGEVLGVSPITANFLGVLAENRRLASLPDIVRAFATISADVRGEVTASVTTAHPLDDAQLAELSAKLSAREGRAVKIRTRVDPDILGGLVVQIGSQMIDGSIRTRLNSLAQAMKA